MAKMKRRRGISFGTWLMLICTFGCVGLGLWVFPRISGDLDTSQFNAARLVAALAPQTSSGTQRPTAQSTPAPTTGGQATPQQGIAPTPAPTARVITINAVGQTQLDGTLRRAYYDEESETYDYSSVFADIAPYMADADLTIATLETAFAGSEAEYGNYNAPDALLDAFKGAGVDVLNFGTERILDLGMNGLKRSRDLAESMGFAVAGANRSAAEQQLQPSFQINDVRIVLLSYTYGLSSAGTKAGDADQRAFAVNLIDPEKIKADVAQARMQGANVVIVNVHWGKRADTKASNATKELADKIVACGADVVLGTHPTSIHPFERRIVDMPDGSKHEVFLAYSLGNFLTNERDNSDNILGTVLQLELTMAPGASKVQVTNAKYLPTWVMRYRVDGNYQYRIVPANLAEAPANMDSTVFKNMTRSYESLVKSIGPDAAQPWK